MQGEEEQQAADKAGKAVSRRLALLETSPVAGSDTDMAAGQAPPLLVTPLCKHTCSGARGLAGCVGWELGTGTVLGWTYMPKALGVFAVLHRPVSIHYQLLQGSLDPICLSCMLYV